MNKKELVKFLKDNYRTEEGFIDLTGLNFGDEIVNIRGLKARFILSTKKEEDKFLNYGQMVECIIENF